MTSKHTGEIDRQTKWREIEIETETEREEREREGGKEIERYLSGRITTGLVGQGIDL